MSSCTAPLEGDLLVDYWTGDLAGPEAEALEEHLFGCGDCTRRLQALAALAEAVAAVAREGRLTGVISRAVLNRLQRDGVRVRYYAIAPGEVVPCAAYPGDDVVVTALRADLAGVASATVTVAGGPGGAETIFTFDDVPVGQGEHEVLWITPAERIRQYPSGRVALTLRSSGADGRLLGEYGLEHHAGG